VEKDKTMKQFICIGGSHYSIDGILAIHNIERQPEDRIPDLITQAVNGYREVQNTTGGNVKICSIRIENAIHTQFAIEIIHMAEERSIVYPLGPHVVKNYEEAVLLNQFIVMEIAQSKEPIIELVEIIEKFVQRPVTQEITNV
jgi:hypothetical protein